MTIADFINKITSHRNISMTRLLNIRRCIYRKSEPDKIITENGFEFDAGYLGEFVMKIESLIDHEHGRSLTIDDICANDWICAVVIFACKQVTEPKECDMTYALWTPNVIHIEPDKIVAKMHMVNDMYNLVVRPADYEINFCWGECPDYDTEHLTTMSTMTLSMKNDEIVIVDQEPKPTDSVVTTLGIVDDGNWWMHGRHF